jgi:hypothetical protein
MLSINVVTVGVGNNEHPLSQVRSSECGSGKTRPLRIVPKAGKIRKDDSQSLGE